MINQGKICSCPASPYYEPNESPAKSWSANSEPCNICLEFIGLDPETPGCPCHIFGEEKAQKFTIKKLKKFFDNGVF